MLDLASAGLSGYALFNPALAPVAKAFSMIVPTLKQPGVQASVAQVEHAVSHAVLVSGMSQKTYQGHVAKARATMAEKAGALDTVSQHDKDTGQ